MQQRTLLSAPWLTSLLRKAGTLALLGLMIQPLDAAVVITEIMAANAATIQDADGDFPDWIEVGNTGTAVESLGGWSLTDRANEPQKWMLPEIILGPGEYRVVFASGKDRRDPEGELHTNFKLGRGGEYLALVRPDGSISSAFDPEYPRLYSHVSYGVKTSAELTTLVSEGDEVRFRIPTPEDGEDRTWTTIGFDDSDWQVGASPIGFDEQSSTTFADLVATDVAAEMRRVNASLFIRVPFTVDDPATLEALQVLLRYNDGFVAYINGEEALRELAPDALNATSKAAKSRGAEAALQLQTRDLSRALGSLRAGENVLAIHALNSAAVNPTFLFSCELQSVSRIEIDTTSHLFYGAPSPGWYNTRGAETIAEAPSSSHETGLYAEPFEVTLSSSVPNAEIRFTLDGTEPTIHGLLYSAPLPIEENTTIAARSFVDGQVRSPVVRFDFAILDLALVDFSSDTPIVVFSTFGNRVTPRSFTRGLMVVVDPTDNGGRSRPLGNAHYVGSAGLKIRGSSSQGDPRNQYSLELWDSEGEDTNFPMLGFESDSDWILFSPPLHTDQTLIRNQFIYGLSRAVGRYAPRSRFVELFLNTRDPTVTSQTYLGVYAFMEKIKRGKSRVDVEELEPFENSEPEVSGGYLLKIDRSDPGDVGFFAGGREIQYVDPKESEITTAQAAWIKDYVDAFAATLGSSRLEDPDGYASYIDVDSWIDHFLLIELARNPDALVLSTYMFKDRDGKLSMGPIWDFDIALGVVSHADGFDNPEGWSRKWNQSWWFRLFSDPAFWRRTQSRWREWRQGPASDENLLAHIDSLVAEINEAQVRNFERWDNIRPVGGWPDLIADLKTWVTTRAAWIDAQILESGLQAPGDINQDRRVNVTDAVVLLRSLFAGAEHRPCSSDEANRSRLDLNEDSAVDLADALFLLRHIFDSSAAPTLELSCRRFDGCFDACLP